MAHRRRRRDAHWRPPLPSEHEHYDLYERVSGLETGIEHLSDEVRGLGRQFGEMREAFVKSGRTDWGVYFAGLGVLLSFVVVLGGGALAPLYIMASNASTRVDAVERTLTERIDDKIQGVNNVRETELKNMDEVLQREMRLLNEAQDTDTEHIQDQLTLLRMEQRTLDSIVREHEKLDGHPTAIQRHMETEKRLDMQAEALNARLLELDSKLQREMELADGAQLERIRSLDEKLQQEIRSVRDIDRLRSEDGGGG